MSQELELQKWKHEALLQRQRVRELEEVALSHEKQSNRLRELEEVALSHEKQSSRLRELEEIALSHENRSKELEQDLSYYKGLKYDEVVKTGHNYTIQTDSLTHFKNGMTLRDTKVRAKEHQTSNAEQIIILHDFLTSDPRLLEKMVQSVLPNGNGEFFRCKLEHIKNCVDILGHTLDTVKSSSEQMTKKEIMEKIYKKLDLTMVYVEEGEEDREEEVVSEVEQWVKENIQFKVNGILELKDLNNRKFGPDYHNLRVKGKFKKEVEKVLRQLGESIEGFEPLCKQRTVEKSTSRGWVGIKLI